MLLQLIVLKAEICFVWFNYMNSINTFFFLSVCISKSVVLTKLYNQGSTAYDNGMHKSLGASKKRCVIRSKCLLPFVVVVKQST